MVAPIVLVLINIETESLIQLLVYKLDRALCLRMQYTSITVLNTGKGI